ncbi:MAG: glycine--tRNA ligase [Euryarchaeota archaeon]|nr:glycine--tRNA ligase [Euryarchaeota archaeon]
MKKDKYEKIMEIARRRGFLWPSAEIYGSVAGLFDFGPLGSILKHNIEQKWRELYLIQEGFYEVETTTLTPEPVFIASGHTAHFVDPITQCEKCGEGFRADHLIAGTLGIAVGGKKIEELTKIIRENKLRCPDCGGNLKDAEYYNLMFKTTIGPGSKRIGFMRPETAQGIFILFNRMLRFYREQFPFGVIQIGRVYRNEISPRQGILRLREFTIAEAEIFVNPKDKSHPRFAEVANEKLAWYPKNEQFKNGKMLEITAREAVKNGYVLHEQLAYYIVRTKQFLESLGIPNDAIRARQHMPNELAHYAIDCWDVEVKTDRFGWIEVTGIADRTDYDVKAHAKLSKTDFSVKVGGENVIPHVIEPSYGIDRIVYCTLEQAYREDSKRTYLAFPKSIAPVRVGVFPLVSKNGLPEKAQEVDRILRIAGFITNYDESGSIGRRYARADEIGTPYSITADYDTIKDQTVTVRDRDSTRQVRVKISELANVLQKLLLGEINLDNAGAPFR